MKKRLGWGSRWKENGSCFSHSYDRGAGWLLVSLFSVNINLVVYLGLSMGVVCRVVHRVVCGVGSVGSLQRGSQSFQLPLTKHFRLGKHWGSRENQTHCFYWRQSLSAYWLTLSFKLAPASWKIWQFWHLTKIFSCSKAGQLWAPLKFSTAWQHFGSTKNAVRTSITELMADFFCKINKNSL